MTEIVKTATQWRRKLKVIYNNVLIGLCAILQFNFLFKTNITILTADEKLADQVKYSIMVILPLVCYKFMSSGVQWFSVY